MLTEFDPFESTFDPAVDPITADTQAFQIIERLEEGKKLLAGFSNPKTKKQIYKKFRDSENKLKANLGLYQKSLQKSGRAALSYGPEVRARKSAVNAESLARYAVKLFDSDEETFKSIVEENGDSETYAEDSAFIADKKFLRDDYIKNKILKKAGFSQREIRNGIGEIMARDAMGADEESDEPTNGTFSRWSRKLINEVDRRNRIATSASELATVRFLGMSEDRDAFEKELNLANPHLSNAERVELRAIRVATHAQLETRFKTIRPLVVEAFNSLALKEGFKSDFLDADTRETGVRDFGEIVQQITSDVPEEDYPSVVAMLAKTSEFHGNNPVKDMDSFTRGVADSAKKLGRNLGLATAGYVGDAFEKNTERRKSPIFRKLQDGFADLIGVGDKMDALDDNPKKIPSELRKIQKFAYELAQWREAIVKTSSTKSGSLWKDLKDSPMGTLKANFVHGVGASLPEMAAALSGPFGLSVIYNAKREEDMQELLRRNPGVPRSELRAASNVSALGYTGLMSFQGKILFGKMPTTKLFTNKFLAGGASLTARLVAETAQESGQDAMLPLTQKLFHSLNEDMGDVNLFGKGGELTKIIKRAPSTAFASAPLILLGIAGSKGARYMDRKTLEGLIKNSDLLETAGLTKPQIRKIQNGDLEHSAETVKQFYPGFLENAPAVDNLALEGVSITPNPETGGFSVDVGKRSAEVRTPEEAVFAVQQLDPAISETKAKAKTKATITEDDLGVLLQFREDRALEGLSPAEFDRQYAEADEASLLADDMLDEAFEADSDSEALPIKAIHGTQTKFAQFELEKFKREIQELPDQDVVYALMDLMGDPSSRKPNDATFFREFGNKIQFLLRKIRAEISGEQVETLAQQYLLEKSENFSGLSENDAIMFVEGRIEDMRKWASFKHGETAKGETAPRIATAGTEAKTKAKAKAKVVSSEKITGLKVDMAKDLATMSAKPLDIDMSLALDPLMPTTNPISHPEVTEGVIGILRAAGIKNDIWFGSKLGKNTSGTFNPNNGVIRVAQHGDIPTAAHEAAHAIQDGYLYKGEVMTDNNWREDTGVPKDVQDQLIDIAGENYAGGTMRSELINEGIAKSEGFAEYIRLKLAPSLNPTTGKRADVAKDYPIVDKWFESNILQKSPELAKSFDAAKKAVGKYADQGALARGEANIADTPTLRAKAVESMRDTAKSTVGDWFEMFDPIRKMVATVEKATGVKLVGTKNPYDVLKVHRMTSDNIVDRMVHKGMVSYSGAYTKSPSLEKILQRVPKKDVRKWLVYLWARRTLALNRSKKPRNSGMLVVDADYLVKKLKNPDFDIAATQFYEWENGVLQYAADSGDHYNHMVGEIRKGDAGDYISLQREFTALDEKFTSYNPGATGQNKLVKHMTGSGRRVMNPLESAIENAEIIVGASQRTAAMESLVDLVEANPKVLGHLVAEIKNDDSIPLAARAAETLLDQIGGKLGGESQRLIQEAKDHMSESEAGTVITMWGKPYVPDSALGRAIIPVMRGGKMKYFEVDREAYEAFKGLEIYRLNKYADLAVGLPNRAWKIGTTTLSLPFQIVTEPLRGTSILYRQTGGKAGLVRTFGEWVAEATTSSLEALTANKFQTTTGKLFEELNLGMTTRLGADTYHRKATVKRLHDGKILRVVRSSELLSYYKDVIQFSDKAVKRVELKRAMRDLGFNPKTDELTPDIAQQITLRAAEVDTDFRGAGKYGRVFNQISPYFGAKVQGIRGHVRAYTKAKDKMTQDGRSAAEYYLLNQFMVRNYIMSGVAVAGWLTYKDEEGWKQMDEREKYSASYIPIPADISLSGEPELLKIPKSHELDGFFMGAPVAILDAIYQDDPKLATDFAKEFAKQTFSASLPVGADYALEVAGKRDTFGRKVVPMWEEVLDQDGQRYRQFGSRTTKVAVSLGKRFDVSPRKIDHFVKSFGGRSSADILEFFGVQGKTEDPHLVNTPILGRLFHPPGQASYYPKSQKEFDEIFADMKARSSAINRSVEETGGQRAARLDFEDARDAMSILWKVEEHTTDQKGLRELRSQRLQIAKSAVALYKEQEKALKD